MQGRLKPVPIEEGRKILSRKGQKFFELEDKGEHPQLPVFSKLSNKKIKPSKVRVSLPLLYFCTPKRFNSSVLFTM